MLRFSLTGVRRPQFFSVGRPHCVVRWHSLDEQRQLEVSQRLTSMLESFAEARALIAESHDSAGTVYFSEDLSDAAEQTKETLRLWNELHDYLTTNHEMDTLEQVKKEHSLKLKQLEAELQAAKDMADH